FLSLPNLAKDTENIRNNGGFIMQMMKQRGIANVQLLDGASPAVPPAVYGEVTVPGAKETLIFYAHYDGQPVNPAQWTDGLVPFTPTLYNRSIGKGGKSIPFP